MKTNAARRKPPERIDQMLKQGVRPEAVASELGLKLGYVLERMKFVHLDVCGQSSDSSTPKFAYHDELCGLLIACGGLPRVDMESRRLVGPDGLPWFERKLSLDEMDRLRTALRSRRLAIEAGILPPQV